MGNNIPQLPPSASVYQRSKHTQPKKVEQQLVVRLEYLPAQPNLLISFAASQSPMEEDTSVLIHRQKYFSLVNVLHYYVSQLTVFAEFRCTQAWLNSCSMRPPGPFVAIADFVVRGGKPADILLPVIGVISIHVVTLTSIPIRLVSV